MKGRFLCDGSACADVSSVAERALELETCHLACIAGTARETLVNINVAEGGAVGASGTLDEQIASWTVAALVARDAELAV